jgi:hypothetical protein
MVEFNCNFVSESGAMSDIIIQQGTDSGYQWPIFDEDGAPYDTTGWAVKAEVRSRQTNEVLHTWSTVLTNAVVEPGLVTLLWSSEESKDWEWTGGRYDLEATLVDGKVVRLDKGYVSVSREITK